MTSKTSLPGATSTERARRPTRYHPRSGPRQRFPPGLHIPIIAVVPLAFIVWDRQSVRGGRIRAGAQTPSDEKGFAAFGGLALDTARIRSRRGNGESTVGDRLGERFRFPFADPVGCGNVSRTAGAWTFLRADQPHTAGSFQSSEPAVVCRRSVTVIDIVDGWRSAGEAAGNARLPNRLAIR